MLRLQKVDKLYLGTVVLWHVTPWNFVGRWQRFGGNCCFPEAVGFPVTQVTVYTKLRGVTPYFV